VKKHRPTPTKVSPKPAPAVTASAASALGGKKPDGGLVGLPGFVRSWLQFWFTPVDPVGLHAVRFLAGVLFIFWLLPFAGNLDAFFGPDGWLDLQAIAEMRTQSATGQLTAGPREMPGWSILDLAGGDPTLLTVVYGLCLGVLVLFTLGLWTRLTSVLTWVIVVSFMANPAIAFDADFLLVMLAFYLMVGYVLLGLRTQRLSGASLLLGSRATWLLGHSSAGAVRSTAANLALRLLQVHLALILFLSGLHKLQFGEWWRGVALWYPLHPAFETSIVSARASALVSFFYLALLSLVGYGVLAWQIGFPFFAWRRGWGWRGLLLSGAVLGWLGCSFVYRLPLYGPALFIGSISFLSAVEWHTLLGWLGKVPQWLHLTRLLPSRERGQLAVRSPEKAISGSFVASRPK
jgi:hypothetical protein